MDVTSIERWHKKARPAPTDKDFNVQLGCHIEEFCELLDSIETDFRFWHRMRTDVFEMAQALKRGEVSITMKNREEFLDSLADQIVTAIGVGYCAGMDVPNALAVVNTSNFSKFNAEGNPIFDANGKVTKGPNYHNPNLTGLY